MGEEGHEKMALPACLSTIVFEKFGLYENVAASC